MAEEGEEACPAVVDVPVKWFGGRDKRGGTLAEADCYRMILLLCRRWSSLAGQDTSRQVEGTGSEREARMGGGGF